jgi:hypothetical protein
LPSSNFKAQGLFDKINLVIYFIYTAVAFSKNESTTANGNCLKNKYFAVDSVNASTLF